MRLLFFALITEVGAPRATVITYVNPAVALALGVALLGEPFTVGIAVGFVLIVLGSVLATRRASTPPTRVPLIEDRRAIRSPFGGVSLVGATCLQSLDCCLLSVQERFHALPG